MFNFYILTFSLVFFQTDYTPKATFLLSFELTYKADGEIYKDNILQPKKEMIFVFGIDISTTSELGFTAALNNVEWKKAFKIPYLTLKDFYAR